MIIVSLIGGLGNQLFQYAAGRRLSVLHNTEIKLDITPFEEYKLHKYSLGTFNIKQAFATPQEISYVKGMPQKGLIKHLSSLSRKLKPYYRQSVFAEASLSPFDPNILKTPQNVYLNGYWQSEKYFLDIQDIIRREFTIDIEQDDLSREFSKKINGVQSVSIHVRRGDYVSDAKTNQVHGMSSINYYTTCVSKIAEKISNPHFFVFSDDPEWIVNNFHLDHPVSFIIHNDASKNYEDLRLMSMCKHNIIANSSFSWWAAWLNQNPEKLIFAPRRWFNDTSLDTRDLIPDSWTQV